MPPTKVKIERIAGDRSRQNTFHKRKLGLIKKAIELTVLTDCDCAIILRSAPTVMCPEGRFSAYCNRDLHEVIGQYMTEAPAEYYTNAEYPRLAKEGYRLDGPISTSPFPSQNGLPAIEVDVESGSHTHAPSAKSTNDSEETKELKKRMADMEAELIKFRNLVDSAVPSPSNKAMPSIPAQFAETLDSRKRSPSLSLGGFFPIPNDQEGSESQTKRQCQRDVRQEAQQQQQQQESNVYGEVDQQSNLAFLDDVVNSQVAPDGLALRREVSSSVVLPVPHYLSVGREMSWDFSAQLHAISAKGFTPSATPQLLPGTIPPHCPPFPAGGEEGGDGSGVAVTQPLNFHLARALQR